MIAKYQLIPTSEQSKFARFTRSCREGLGMRLTFLNIATHWLAIIMGIVMTIYNAYLTIAVSDLLVSLVQLVLPLQLPSHSHTVVPDDL